MLSVFWLVPSCTHAKSLREFDLASSSLESATATASLVTLPSYYLYSAFRSGSYNMPTWSNLPWKTLLPADLCAQLYYQIWPYLLKREMCKITCQESWSRWDGEQYSVMSWKISRTQNWMTDLDPNSAFNGWGNELGQNAELYDMQGALPIQNCLPWKLFITYKSIKVLKCPSAGSTVNIGQSCLIHSPTNTIFP